MTFIEEKEYHHLNYSSIKEFYDNARKYSIYMEYMEKRLVANEVCTRANGANIYMKTDTSSHRSPQPSVDSRLCGVHSCINASSRDQPCGITQRNTLPAMSEQPVSITDKNPKSTLSFLTLLALGMKLKQALKIRHVHDYEDIIKSLLPMLTKTRRVGSQPTMICQQQYVLRTPDLTECTRLQCMEIKAKPTSTVTGPACTDQLLLARSPTG